MVRGNDKLPFSPYHTKNSNPFCSSFVEVVFAKNKHTNAPFAILERQEEATYETHIINV